MGIRAVSFDLGHTLVFPRYEVYQELLSTSGVSVGRTELVAMEARLRPWFDERIIMDGGLKDAIWADYYHRFFGGLGAVVEDIVPMLYKLMDQHREGIGLFSVPLDGAREVLLELREMGLQVACVSNNDGRLEAAVAQLGWNDCFDLLVDSQTIGFSKPDPRIFEHALGQMGLEPDELVHVGDYYSVDVVGARNAGVEGILYDPEGAYSEIDCAVIGNMNEVKSFL
jgi:putative hydrolase of the HAD superfamily